MSDANAPVESSCNDVVTIPAETARGDTSSGTRWLAQEAMIIGVATVLCALAAMAFEVGYASVFFGTPIELIEINAQRTLVVALMMLIGALPVFLYLFFAYTFYSEGRPLVRVVGAAMLFSWPFAVLLPSFAISPIQWYFAAAVAGFCLLLGVARSIHQRIRHGRSMSEALNANAKGIAQFWSNIPESRREPTFFDGVLACGILVMIPLGYVMAVGARLPTWFTHSVLSDTPNYVFVRRYSDNFVFKEFDPATGVILNGIEIRSLHGGAPLLMQKAKVALRGWWEHSEAGDFRVDRLGTIPADALLPENVPR